MHRRQFLSALAAAGLLPRSLVLPGPRSTPGYTASGIYALVLGSVQDAGFPQVGCYTDRCNEGRALQATGHGRFVSSLALVEPEAERFYLVDATPDITRQLDLIAEPAFRARAAARRPFDGIFLTHAHIGHYAGLAELGNEGMGMQKTPVYCTQAMADFLAANYPWRFLVEQGRIDLKPLALDRWHRIDPLLEVQLWKVPHRDELSDTVGFVFRGPDASLLFLPDINSWSLWERDVAEAVASVDVALLDGSFWSMEELPGRTAAEVPHPLMAQTMDALQGVADEGKTRIVLTHLNNSNPALDDGGPQQRAIARRGFTIAREGMILPL
ncbi:MAG: MBL fold metallo-hydrolase [Gemmatimonadota bacterium]|jgi:pyrroloquinoline quinone biosynthesis protein B|nr:MBL fold metallo-hydrolase [Gemmatimonadota bacterium]MDH4348029.1 MBL fold metallo-hydrolase [Gemmatimonadota bacterium]MDH5283709.1 MBL fold metallo-hydrolase [Gemmatimonadota bacterium]